MEFSAVSEHESSFPERFIGDQPFVPEITMEQKSIRRVCYKEVALTYRSDFNENSFRGKVYWVTNEGILLSTKNVLERLKSRPEISTLPLSYFKCNLKPRIL